MLAFDASTAPCTRGAVHRSRPAIRAALALGVLLAAQGCLSLPRTGALAKSEVLAPPTESLLSLSVAADVARHQGESGLIPLLQGEDALLARFALAHMAGRSLDLQYYIWRDDFTGRLLLRSLLYAADRGVRVRLLLDDVGAHPGDETLLALDAHHEIEVRLFNTAASRSMKFLSTLFQPTIRPSSPTTPP